jgi:hypothetical protein
LQEKWKGNLVAALVRFFVKKNESNLSVIGASSLLTLRVGMHSRCSKTISFDGDRYHPAGYIYE